MMTGKYLVDTNIVIEYFSGDDTLKELIDQSDGIYISIISMGELYFGALKSERSEPNLALVDDRPKRIPTLGCDIRTAQEFSEIKYQLMKKGKPIPVNDIWIAAIAKQHNLVLLTRDNHFNYIDELKKEVP